MPVKPPYIILWENLKFTFHINNTCLLTFFLHSSLFFLLVIKYLHHLQWLGVLFSGREDSVSLLYWEVDVVLHLNTPFIDFSVAQPRFSFLSGQIFFQPFYAFWTIYYMVTSAVAAFKLFCFLFWAVLCFMLFRVSQAHCLHKAVRCSMTELLTVKILLT